MLLFFFPDILTSDTNSDCHVDNESFFGEWMKNTSEIIYIYYLQS